MPTSQFCGLMRVRNEERWIEESLESLLLACGQAVVFDDHSEDSTVEICEKFSNVTVIKSQFYGLDEARDKTFLLQRAIEITKADWFFWLDGDEIVETDAADKLKAVATCIIEGIRVADVTVLYYWNGTEKIRWDGAFKYFTAQRIIRPGESFIMPDGDGPGNLHCGCIPLPLLRDAHLLTDIALWHYGYIDPVMRRAKHEWYVGHDSGNVREDGYIHIIQGDPDGPAADAVLKNGGPLELVGVKEFLESRDGCMFTPPPRGIGVK